MASKIGIAFETVFSSQGKLEFLHKAKEAGYFIRLFFVGTSDPKINVRRVLARKMKGGHNVPIDKIIQRYYRSVALYTQAAKFVNRSYLYDNSVDIDPKIQNDYVPPIIFRTKSGVVVKAYQSYPTWTLPILNELQIEPGVQQPEGHPSRPSVAEVDGPGSL